MLPKFGSALGAAILIAYFCGTHAFEIERRALQGPTKPSGSWVSKGCYVDVGRTLSNGGYNDNLNMTAGNCIAYCSKLGNIYAGTEYGQECYCGMTIASAATVAATSDCSKACSGNATEPCGGGSRLNLYWSGTAGPQTNPGPGLWKFAGCYTEGKAGRTLLQGVGTTGGSNVMTVELCTSACKTAGFNLAGVEYGGECYCGNSISNGGVLAAKVEECNMLCRGNFSEYCGAGSRLGVYNYNNIVALPPYTTVTSSTTSSVPSSTLSSTSTTVSPTTSRSTTSTSVLSTGTNSSSLSTTVASTSSTTTTTSRSRTSTTSSSSSLTSSTTSRSSTSSSLSSTSTLPSTTSSVTSRSLLTSSSTSTLSSTTSSVVSTSSSSSSSSLSTNVPSTSASSIVLSSSSSSTSSAPPRATTLSRMATIGPYSYLGCYTEATGARALTGAAFFDYTGMTLEICATNCAAFTYWGVEYGGECYCGNDLGAGSVLVPTGGCGFTCPGNSLEYCGAGSQLELYKLGPKPTGSSSSSTTSGTSTSTLVSITTTSSTASTAPLGTGFPTGWTDQGCWVDGAAGRILNNQQQDNQAMTLQSCVNKCVSLGYTIAGMEYGQQCFCDNFIYNGGAKAAAQTDCNMNCAGNPDQKCGAGGRMTIYSSGIPQVFQPPGPQTTGLPVGWTYKGCLEDNIPSVEDPNQQLYTFPYKVWDNQINTPTSCIAQCNKFGFNAAGLEYGSQCFCGDVENIKTASAPGVASNPAMPQWYTRSRTPLIVADAKCEAACTGDKTHLCGSGNLLTYYAYEGATPLYKWDFPTGTAAGKYELLIGGVTVPLMTAQMVTGKVTFIEKTGSGEANGTGQYELDLSQTGDFSKAWRPMTGVQTDVFCSAGLILPDKAGRQLTIGGWAGESNFGVRLYYPDGKDGVPGVNQWAEDRDHLTLQVPRWYPSALILANGSIMVVGGEIGSNADQQPTLEILPATGVPVTGTVSGYSNTTKYLDFLQRTHPFNLYPFVTVVPSGIFIAYYNEARILDEVTFETKKILPNMPGSVVDPKAGRTYQLEGSFVTLPQIAPYTKNMEVLICGGSTEGASDAIDNCVTTAPEDPSPVWTIERMPSRRVLPCMAGLPDGTYVILNGGHHGVAGFGLASAPNGNAVLYDPSKPIKQRMSVMANTTIARMYHSEAIVMLDGRVLVSGSDPTGDYSNPPTAYPEEHRVEVFVPPYLTSGLARPTFTITNKDWTYNQQITFNIGAPIAAGTLKVTLLGAVVSTHGNSMGQRTLVPAVSCSGTLCTVTSPNNVHTAPPGWFMMFVLNGPTPSVGQFVRIGGDPAALGSWPKLPNFQLPGV